MLSQRDASNNVRVVMATYLMSETTNGDYRDCIFWPCVDDALLACATPKVFGSHLKTASVNISVLTRSGFWLQ